MALGQEVNSPDGWTDERERQNRTNEIKRNICSARVPLSAINSRPAEVTTSLQALPSNRSSQKLWHSQIAQARIDLINVSFHGSHPSSHWLKDPLHFFSYFQKQNSRGPGILSTYQDIIVVIQSVLSLTDVMKNSVFFFFVVQLVNLFYCFSCLHLQLLLVVQTIKSLKFKSGGRMTRPVMI